MSEPHTPGPLVVRWLGLTDYQTVWQLQKELQQARIRGECPDTLLFCEHNPVITLGTSAQESNVLGSPEQLAALGVQRFSVERGGDVTYHGPGQLVAYPIFDLGRHKRDVHWYMRALESVVITTLKHFEITGFTVAGKTGVWTAWEQDDSHTGRLSERKRKIASIGVRISRWCTMHGFALNVRDLSSGFALINPCGFTDVTSTSMESELASVPATSDCVSCPTVLEVGTIAAEKLRQIFSFQELDWPADARSYAHL